MQLRANGPVCLLALVVAALDWAFGSRRANGMTHQTLPLFGQSLYPPVCLLQEGRQTQGGEKGINCLMRPCLPSRGQNLCMYLNQTIKLAYRHCFYGQLQSGLGPIPLRKKRGEG